MGKLRARVARAAGTRGTWITCSLLLAGILLGGCNGTSGSAAQATAAAQPGGVAGAGGAAAQGASPGTQTSSPPPAGKSIQVSWSAPTTNTNGSALTDLAGYRVYYGTSPDTLDQSVDVPRAGATDYVVPSLKSGTWYFAVAAYTNTGLESVHSHVVSKTIT